MHVCVSNVNHPKRAITLQVNNLKALFVFAAIILSVTIADQISKILVVHFLSDQLSVKVLGQFLMLTLLYNEGGALGTSFGPSSYYLVTSLLVFIFVLYYLFLNRHHKLTAYPLAFIAGGALGNIIDRIRLGKVVDWIDIDFFDIDIFGFHLERWWTFNVADAAISCSIVFMLASLLYARYAAARMSRQEEIPHGPRLPESNVDKN